MDVMRPSQAFAAPHPHHSAADDARRWLRLALVMLAGAITHAALRAAAQ
jgi:hypothetical protein